MAKNKTKKKEKDIYTQHVNDTPLTGEELMTYSDEVHAIGEKDQCFEAKVAVGDRLFKDWKKTLSAHSRMVALAELVESGTLPGWAQKPNADGSIPVNEAIFHAAAKARMKIKDNKLIFVKTDLLRKAFQAAKTFK